MTSNPTSRALNVDTAAAHSGMPEGTGEQPLSPPLWLTSEYRYDSLDDYTEAIAGRDGDAYVRGAAPTTRQLHTALAALDRAEAAWAFPGGMAAVRAVFSVFAPSTSHVVTARTIYGGTVDFIRDIEATGTTVTTVAPTADEVARAITPETSMVFVEGLANPTLEVADIAGISQVCREAGIRFVIDNSLATSILLRPAEIDPSTLVVHSMTKYLSGHSDVVGGAITGPADDIERLKSEYLRAGSHFSAFDSFLVLRGMETLAVRVRRHCETASRLAQVLDADPRIEQVWHPSLASTARGTNSNAAGFDGGLHSPMLSFRVAEGGVDLNEFSRRLRIVQVISSFGGTRSALCRPSTTSHRQLSGAELTAAGIHPDMLRLAVGLEDFDDLVADIDAALSVGRRM